MGEGPALNWVRGRAADECPSAPDIARAVEGFVGPVLVSPSTAQRSFEGLVSRQADGHFTARITVTDGDGSPQGAREWVVGHDCARVREQAAFIIAITLDPSAMQRLLGEVDRLFGAESGPGEALLAEMRKEPIAEPEPPAREPEKDSRKQANEPKAVAVPKPRRKSRVWAVGVGLGAWAGVVPRPTSSARLELGRLAPGWARLGIMGTALWPRTRRDDGAPDVLLGAAMLGLRWCTPAWRPGAIELDGCLGVDARLLWGRGRGLAQKAADRALDWGPRAEVRLAWRWFERSALFARAGVLLSARTPSFRAGAGDTTVILYRPDRLGAGGSLGVERRF